MAGVLRKKGGLQEPIKEQLRESRKEKMRTVEHFLCDQCNLLIKPDDGFVVHGNIYVADPANLRGVIGNNFPSDPDACVSAVKKTVLCKRCFLEAIESVGLERPPGTLSAEAKKPPRRIDIRRGSRHNSLLPLAHRPGRYDSALSEEESVVGSPRSNIASSPRTIEQGHLDDWDDLG